MNPQPVTGQTLATFLAANKRAVLMAGLIVAGMFLHERPDTGTEALDVFYDSLDAVIVAMLARGGLEGGWDALRQRAGAVSPSDVQPNQPAVVVENAALAPPVVPAPPQP